MNQNWILSIDGSASLSTYQNCYLKNTFSELLSQKILCENCSLKKTFSKFQTFHISRFCREPTILSQISRSHSKAQNPHGKLTSNTLSFLCAHRRYFLKRLTCLPGFSVESKKFIKESLIYKHKKRGVKISYVGFTAFFKIHFIKYKRQLMCLKTSLTFMPQFS